MTVTQFAPYITILGLFLTILPIAECNFINQKLRNSLGELISTPGEKSIFLNTIVLNATDFFNIFFGKKHLSYKCFLRSAFCTLFFTISSILMIYICWDISDLERILRVFLTKDNFFFLILTFFVAVIIDYISLWETRCVIGWTKVDTTLFSMIILLIMDALFSFSIFIILLSLYKTIVDIFLLVPYLNEELVVKHGEFITFFFNKGESLFSNFLIYYCSVIKYCLLSCYSIFHNNLNSYWFASLFLPEGEAYVLPASTFWLTTHFSSLYIYFQIMLWIIGKMSFLQNLSISKKSYQKLFFIPNYKYNPKEYPITVLAIHGFFYYIIIYFIIYKNL